MNKKVKQVIIWCGDVRNAKGHKLTVGKVASQVAHASVALLLNAMRRTGTIFHDNVFRYDLKMDVVVDDYWHKWIDGKFTKIVVYCNNEAELLEIYKQAKDAQIPSVLITDAGLTEFNGVPTNTCVGIGPFWEDDINKITGHLPLL